jgi:glutathione synthase/RimK-type ligase-like ATP-grasp enzyme
VNRLVVVENTAHWPLRLEGAQVVSARHYLTDPRYAALRPATVFNVCRHYGYQSLGYYVSLLAAARGHRPLPSVETLQDLRLAPVVRVLAADLEEEVQRALRPLRSRRFELSVYFGRNLARRYERLSRALFDLFPAPFLRASFLREREWKLQTVRPVATSEIPEAHRDFVMRQAREYFAHPRRRRRAPSYRYDLAILRDPSELNSPSNDTAIRKFLRAARDAGLDAEIIGREDHHAVAEFDALFLRETTSVNHHTYRMARRAAAEGLVVIDDPESIVRCTNKVFQAELFARHGVPSPETLVVHEGNADEVRRRLGFPCVLKRPDSSFSQGVVRVGSAEDLEEALRRFFADSQLVVAQRYVPSAFDWRIGVLAGRALYACRYHMAPGHWQIVRTDGEKGRRFGLVEAVPLAAAPRGAVAMAERIASLIGEGLYGVDVKELDARFLVMEVNDNPSLDAGCEDGVLGDALYAAIMGHFRERLDARGRRTASR